MNKQIDPNKQMTAKQVADILDVHPRTVKRMVLAGKLPNAKRVTDDYPTAPYLIPGSDVIAYLKDK